MGRSPSLYFDCAPPLEKWRPLPNFPFPCFSGHIGYENEVTDQSSGYAGAHCAACRSCSVLVPGATSSSR